MISNLIHLINLEMPPRTIFLLKASSIYNPLHAALTPAASFGKPLTFIHDVKMKIGGKSIGKVRNGRTCCAVMRVAMAMGGREDSVR